MRKLIFAAMLMLAAPCFSTTWVMRVKPTMKSEFAPSPAPRVVTRFQQLGLEALRPVFPTHASGLVRPGKRIDLSLFWTFEVGSGTSAQWQKDLMASGWAVYVEPKVMPTLTFTPNDPSLLMQYHLSSVRALTAWDVETGDTAITVGITDTGIELGHTDLSGAIQYNYSDPMDGLDNDGDGYVDNRYGWDLGNNDNNPSPDPCQTCNHGVHVSGIAGAETNNNVGIAGVGFACRLLPVKIMNSAGELNMAYEGIVYAADHNCKVINCSWGSPSGGQFGQDIVDYAVLEKGCLVVAAAGNSAIDSPFYPAAYAHVLSVCASNSSDVKWSQSNYGRYVDLAAPGEGIYSTWISNGYTSSSGTSMASPVVAGGAALVASHFPGISPMALAERLRATADNIDTVAGNAAFAGKLGSGRLNLYRALTETGLKSVVLDGIAATDGNDQALVSGDTVRIQATLINALSPLSNFQVQLSSASSFVQMLSTVYAPGAADSGDTLVNAPDDFRFRILPNAPPNQIVEFALTCTDAGFTQTLYFSLTLNVNYLNISIADIATSITSNGRLGYNTTNQTQGLGVRLNGGSSVLYEASFMAGVPDGRVVDMARGAVGGQTDADFTSLQSVYRIVPPVVSEFDARGLFDDFNAGTSTIGLQVRHQAFAWSSPGNTRYVMVQYTLQNTSFLPISGLHAGIYADWDVMNYNLNLARLDSTQRMGYVFSTEANGLYAGIKVLSSNAPYYVYGLDHVTGGAGGVNLADGFSGADKFQTLSQVRNRAGTLPNGSDVSQTVSTGPFTLASGDSVTVAFAILAAENLALLQEAAAAAQEKYDGAPTGVSQEDVEASFAVVPNPSPSGAELVWSGRGDAPAQVEVLDLMGRRVSLQNWPYGRLRMNLEMPLYDGLYMIRIPGKSKVGALRWLVSGK